MRTSLLGLLIFLAGCAQAGDNGPVLVVTASYPGASPQVVADTVAVQIEQHINGTEQLARIESESRTDGSYVALLRFKTNADADIAVQLVKDRIELAKPSLPDLVARGDILVKVMPAAKENKVAIALVDQAQHGPNAMRKFADVVLKRIEDEKALGKPETFPASDKDPWNVELDHKQGAACGVAPRDVVKAIDEIIAPVKAAKLDEQIAAFKKARVKTANGGEVELSRLATVREHSGPIVVFRVDLHPAIRISGTAQEGTSAHAATAHCIKLAESERQKLGHVGIGVMRVSGH